jgi:hypothetical protein
MLIPEPLYGNPAARLDPYDERLLDISQVCSHLCRDPLICSRLCRDPLRAHLDPNPRGMGLRVSGHCTRWTRGVARVGEATCARGKLCPGWLSESKASYWEGGKGKKIFAFSRYSNPFPNPLPLTQRRIRGLPDGQDRDTPASSSLGFSFGLNLQGVIRVLCFCGTPTHNMCYFRNVPRRLGTLPTPLLPPPGVDGFKVNHAVIHLVSGLVACCICCICGFGRGVAWPGRGPEAHAKTHWAIFPCCPDIDWH